MNLNCLLCASFRVIWLSQFEMASVALLVAPMVFSVYCLKSEYGSCWPESKCRWMTAAQLGAWGLAFCCVGTLRRHME